MQAVVFTGGPGTGKTTVLHALRDQGYTVVDDTARAIIQNRLRQSLPPRPPPREFAEAILREDIEKYRRSADASGYVFFDRGILDALCMLDRLAPLPLAELDAVVTKFPYHRQVFCFPPWEAIYTCDTERDQTFAQAMQVHTMAVEWYRRCQYEVVEVPEIPVDDRCAFVLEVLGQRV